MDIKPADVKKLREQTGAGMGDCKKSLIEANGDFAQAIKILKEKGLAAAAKRSSRATKEGKIFTAVTYKKAVILELSCETDFVARNEKFLDLGKALVSEIISSGIYEINDKLAMMVKEAVGIIKENMTIARFKVLDIADGEYIADYVHGAGNIGVLVKFKSDDAEIFKKKEIKDFTFDCALHVTAFSPIALSGDKVDPAYLKDQEEIFTKQCEGMNKPANVIEGIIKGKMRKHLSEICFLDQPFVKDDKKKVSQVLTEAAKAAGGKLEITDYVYYKLGENA